MCKQRSVDRWQWALAARAIDHFVMALGGAEGAANAIREVTGYRYHSGSIRLWVTRPKGKQSRLSARSADRVARTAEAMGIEGVHKAILRPDLFGGCILIDEAATEADDA